MRGRVLGAFAAGAVAVAVVTIVVWPGPGAPRVEPRLRAELTPVIRQHLETRVDHGGALAQQPELKSRWFCEVHLAERPLDRARRAYGLPPGTPVQDAF